MAQPRSLPKLPKTVDRSIVRMVAMKRIATGCSGLIAGAVMIYLTVEHGGGPTPLLGLGILLLWGGGAWTLRDGLRLRRDLRQA
jgi:hypothetical protein